ncbi:hypothetical protein THAOC_03706 [Thalassiosira oceanica]|uniref:Homeobox domain-containing protein n=1 Tax=Thalassiosira oceanica TaxID=159749 RepID=K0TAT0_THAOC|nr:hypothetical protein THAOC_03706 [Thalassiosira oceanica]|eukprot:EJK74605.1 hypothetical protein THAOC_03706 [Thalassiosira oceanica]
MFVPINPFRLCLPNAFAPTGAASLIFYLVWWYRLLYLSGSRLSPLHGFPKKPNGDRNPPTCARLLTEKRETQQNPIMPRKKTKKTKLTPAEKKDRKRPRDRVRQAKKRARLRENRNQDEPLPESKSRTLMPTLDVSRPEGGPPRPPSPSSAAPVARTSDGGEPARAQLSDEAKAYLTKWLHEHKAHPYPSRQKKDEMCNLLRISDPSQLDGWLCRARTKLRYQTSQSGSQVPKGFAKGYPTGARPTNSELAAGGGKPTGDDSEEAAAAMPAHDDANAPAKTPSGVALKKTPPATAEPPARSTLAVAGHEREETVFVTAPPGSLGVTVRTDGPSFGVITSINPAACKFAGRVSEGDRIATVDGRAAKCVADLKVGGGGERVVGVVRKKQRRGGGGPGEERPGKRHRQSPASTAAEAKSDGRTTSGQNPPGRPAASALPQADPLSLGRNPAPSVADVTGAIEAATDLASRLAEERRAEVLPALSRLARLCAPDPDALYPKKPEPEGGGEEGGRSRGRRRRAHRRGKRPWIAHCSDGP